MNKFRVPLEKIEKNDLESFLSEIDKNEKLFVDFKVVNSYIIGNNNHNDFKAHKDDICQDIVSFLNTYGGYLIYGVDDTGEIRGMDKSFLDSTKSFEDQITKRVMNLVNGNISPNFVGLQFRIISLENNRIVVIIQIPQGYQKWYVVNRNNYPVHIARNEKGITILDRDSIKWGYIETESAKKKMDEFIHDRDPEIHNKKNKLLVYCIPVDFLSRRVTFEDIVNNTEMQINLTGDMRINRIDIENSFEIDNFCQKVTDVNKQTFWIRLFINGIIEVETDVSETNPYHFLRNFEYSLKKANWIVSKDIEYIITMKAIITKNAAGVEFGIWYPYEKFLKCLIDFQNIIFKMPEIWMRPELRPLANQLFYMLNEPIP